MRVKRLQKATFILLFYCEKRWMQKQPELVDVIVKRTRMLSWRRRGGDRGHQAAAPFPLPMVVWSDDGICTFVWVIFSAAHASSVFNRRTHCLPRRHSTPKCQQHRPNKFIPPTNARTRLAVVHCSQRTAILPTRH